MIISQKTLLFLQCHPNLKSVLVKDRLTKYHVHLDVAWGHIILTPESTDFPRGHLNNNEEQCY